METQHSLVQYQDILHDVLQCFAPASDNWKVFEDKTLSRRTLARCARVCKAFRDPALDVLWRNLVKPEPLLDLLPSVVEKIEHWHLVLMHSYKSTGASAPDKDEWITFCTYAKRVRRLSMDLRGDSSLDQAIWLQLFEFSRNEPLIPHLTTLDWVQTDEGLAIFAFITPSLQEIRLNLSFRRAIQGAPMGDMDNMLHRVLSTLASNSSSLLKLEILNEPHPSSLIPIMDLVELRHLDFPAISLDCSREFLNSLGKMNSLRSLSLRLTNVPMNDDISARLPGFHSLEELDLSGSPFRVTQFLHQVESRKLHSIRLYLSIPLQADSTSQKDPSNLSQIALQKFADCLQSVKIVCVLPNGPAGTNIARICESLKHLHRLQILRIELSRTDMLHSECIDIKSCFKDWPKLRYFSIYDEIESLRVPLTDLPSIAEFCPLLKFFKFPRLEISALDALSLGTFPILNHGLKDLRCNLSVWDPSMDTIMRLCQYLDHLFPDLNPSTACKSQGEYPAGDYPGRKSLSKTLSMLQTARKSDRKRTKRDP